MGEPITITLVEASDRCELAALSHIWSILDRFNPHQRGRMLDYLCEVFPRTELETRDQAQ